MAVVEFIEWISLELISSIGLFCPWLALSVFFRVKARSGSSQRQHQSAAKDLTQSPEVSPTTIQVTYLPSSQKSKRAKHFLELKSFKDNYNTLESTLWCGWRTLCWWSQTDCSVLARQPSGHLAQQPRLDQLTLQLCLELLPRRSFSNAFLWPVSEHQLRLYFPLVALFSGFEFICFS